MIVKKAGGKVYGATFTAAERKAMNMEINRQIIEADKRYTDDIDAMILYTWRFTWASARRGSDAFMRPLPQSMTASFATTKCPMTAPGSARKS